MCKRRFRQEAVTVAPVLIVLVCAGILAFATAGCPGYAEGGSRKACASTHDRLDASEVHARLEKATFAAGCFWGVEEAFRHVPGVTDTEVGYTGGSLENPTYRDVCSGRTGHAESVLVTYDPSRLPYEELLDVFFMSHDPTTPDRQGPDVGTQYRSAIFWHTPEQRDAAEKAKRTLDEAGAFSGPITTHISPASTFYRAEEYHQRYMVKRGRASCHTP
ncbi:MAG TPA: peptide-methionine (S)-S-oxide reductase [Candidatus Hydrogenedentes bacterium]|nr:peptide-methionine (S)-S-oxide reductase [Candidatus Hydrogenedentota bacterium]